MTSRKSWRTIAVLAVLGAAGIACSDDTTSVLMDEVRPVAGLESRQATHGKSGMAPAVGGLVTEDLNTLSAATLAAYLAGPGISISNVSYTGDPLAAGRFADGLAILGIQDGVVLSSGDIALAKGPNTSQSMTRVNGMPGDAALTTLAGSSTFDAAILSFDFVPTEARVYFQYVFASDEYNEFVASQYNDVFAFWVNGVNCAVVGNPTGGPGDPVSINTINHGHNASMVDARNPSLYINNDPWHGGVSATRDTEMDGLTVVLVCEADVVPNETNTMMLAIADAGDSSYDSNVFIRAGSFSVEIPKPNPPGSVWGTPTGPTGIDVGWTDVSTNETRFELQRRVVNADPVVWVGLPNQPANATAFSDAGVTASTTYRYRVRSCNDGGCSAFVSSPSITTPAPTVTIPLAPAELSATPVSGTVIDLAWLDQSSDEDNFQLQRRVLEGDVWSAFTTIANPAANATSFSDTGALPGTTYRYRIRSCNTAGCSVFVLSAIVTTPGAEMAIQDEVLRFLFLRDANGAAPAAGVPSDSALIPRFTTSGGSPKVTAQNLSPYYHAATATATASAGTLLANIGTSALEWTATSDQAWLGVSPAQGALSPSYSVALIATVGAADLPLGLSTGTVTVTDPAAVNSPQSFQATAEVVTAAPLLLGVPVTGLAGPGGPGYGLYFILTVPSGATNLTIATSGGTGDVDLYVRYGDVPSEMQWDCRPLLGGNTESCLSVLPAAGTYYILLAGGAFSGVTLTAALGGPPFAPSGVTSTPTGATQVQTAWTDNSTNETSFAVQRRQRIDGVWGTWGALGSAAENALGYLDATATAEGTFRYRVRACNAAGCSAWSVGPTVTTPAAPTGPPAAPASILAHAISPTQVGIGWEDVANETGYTVQRRMQTGGVWGAYGTIGTTVADMTGIVDNDVTGGTTYQYRVRACNADGCSVWKASTAVTTPAASPPAAPTDVTASAFWPDEVEVFWTDASDNEDGFEIQRRQYVDAVWSAWTLIASPAANENVYLDMTVSPSSRYQFRMRSCNTAGCSIWVPAPAVNTPAS